MGGICILYYAATIIIIVHDIVCILLCIGEYDFLLSTVSPQYFYYAFSSMGHPICLGGLT